MSEDVDLKNLVADVAAAYFANSHVTPSEISTVINHIATSLSSVGALSALPLDSQPETPKVTPAQIRNSITRDALISFEDNKPYKTLRRHLAVRGLTPEQYRERWGLPKEYPMVAPSYSEARAQVARSIGLGGRASAAKMAPPVREARKASPAADAVRNPEAAPVNRSHPIQPETVMTAAPSSAGAAAVEKLTSAEIERSITAEALISFEDGKPYKQLKRHLAARGMTPHDYRAKWGLPSDYPMVAANLSAARAAVAVRSGLSKTAAPVRAVAQPTPPAVVASSIAQASLQARPEMTEPEQQIEEPTQFLEAAPATKPAKARIPGRLGLFGRRPTTA